MTNETSYILQILQEEFAHKTRNGLYSLTQTALAYHSNHMEGSTLTEAQTTFLFDTGTIGGEEAFYRAKDVEEAQGHFLMFNDMLKTIGEPLSEEIIKQFHYDLKSGVFEDRANGYAIGEYKKRPNRVGTITTAFPDEVPARMQELLAHYHEKEYHNYDDLIHFHVAYETIHPFQDGNGRTGRLILFRECLKNGLPPIIIRDAQSPAYKLALGIAQTEGEVERLKSIMESESKWYMEIARPYIEYARRQEMLKRDILL